MSKMNIKTTSLLEANPITTNTSNINSLCACVYVCVRVRAHACGVVHYIYMTYLEHFKNVSK